MIFIQTMGILQANRTGILPEQKYRAAYHAEYFPRILRR